MTPGREAMSQKGKRKSSGLSCHQKKLEKTNESLDNLRYLTPKTQFRDKA
jgi:hypothetical protein